MKSAQLLLLSLALALSTIPAAAHIGSPNVVLEGDAGPYPVRVIIRPPGVVPGLAEISVRVRTNGVDQVTVLPVHWRAGEQGAPPPDVAHPVVGDPNLYNSELWLMTVGSYSVYVTVHGAYGQGTVIVPVASIATSPRAMPRMMSVGLLGLAALLCASAVTLVGAALRESVLPPRTPPSRARVWGARGGMLAAGILLALALIGGQRWWNSIDIDYRNNRLYKAMDLTATVDPSSPERLLRLTLDDEEWQRTGSPLVPDHGKLMHLFLVRENSLDVLAHLHPTRVAASMFQTVLPPLPAGNYRAYADVTEESGLAHTLTTMIEIPPAPESTPRGSRAAGADPDDSWHTDNQGPFHAEYDLGGGLRMIWENADTPHIGSLRFKVVDAADQLVELEPYMGMMGHAAVRKLDGKVFAHLHPSGTISVAAQQVFQLRAQGKPADTITAAALEKLCRVPTLLERRQTLQFPYEFPQAGSYRLWVQVKHEGIVKTAVFDADL